MILAITIKEMQRLNIACKRVLGDEEWTRRSEVAWESLRALELVTADMLESAVMDGFGQQDGVHFDREEAAGIGQDHSQAPPCVQLQLGAEYGREQDCVGFWINSPEIGQTDADSPSPCHRIALALIRWPMPSPRK